MHLYKDIISAKAKNEKLLAILIDPEKFEIENAGVYDERSRSAEAYLQKLPIQTTHLFVGGSTDSNNETEAVVNLLKQHTALPILLFPGSHLQVTNAADGILFLSLISGRNPEYLIGQQVAAAPIVARTNLEVIPTGYILIDGHTETAVARVSETQPMAQDNIQSIVETALAGQYLGKKCIYLEAGSGAQIPVSTAVIQAVQNAIEIPLIVGGGIRTESTMQAAYAMGADMVVIGTAFEEGSWNE